MRRFEDDDEGDISDSNETFISVPSIYTASVNGDKADQEIESSQELDKFVSDDGSNQGNALLVAEPGALADQNSVKNGSIGESVNEFREVRASSTEPSQNDKKVDGSERCNNGSDDTKARSLHTREFNQILESLNLHQPENEVEQSSNLSQIDNTLYGVTESKKLEDKHSEKSYESGEESADTLEDQSENEEDLGDDGNSSEEIGCFGDDESGSQTSIEQWREIEVGKDIANKIAIHKPGEELVLNLEVIGQISRGEINSGSEVSDKSQEMTGNEKSIGEDKVKGRSGSNENKVVINRGAYEHTVGNNCVKLQRKIRKKQNHCKDEGAVNSTNVATENGKDVSGSNNSKLTLKHNTDNKSLIREIKSHSDIRVEDDNSRDESESDIATDNDSDGSGSSSTVSNTESNSEDNSERSSNTVKISVTLSTRRDSGYSHQKQVPTVSDKATVQKSKSIKTGNSTYTKYDNLSITTTRSVKSSTKEATVDWYSKDSKCDCKSVSSLKSVKVPPTRESHDNPLNRHKTDITDSLLTRRNDGTKSNNRLNNRHDHSHSHLDRKTKPTRREHIENLKRVYRQKVTLKNQKHKTNSSTASNAFPDITTPKQISPSYSSKEQICHESHKSKKCPHKIITNVGSNLESTTAHDPPEDVKGRILGKVEPNDAVLLTKRREPNAGIAENKSVVKVTCKDLNTKKSNTYSDLPHETKPLNQTKLKTQVGDNEKGCLTTKVNSTSPNIERKPEGNDSDTNCIKNINGLHNEISAICGSDINEKQDSSSRAHSKTVTDRRLEKAMQEMFALHGNSLDKNDTDFTPRANIDTPRKQDALKGSEVVELPTHITQALIVDMPIDRVPNQNIISSKKIIASSKASKKPGESPAIPNSNNKNYSQAEDKSFSSNGNTNSLRNQHDGVNSWGMQKKSTGNESNHRNNVSADRKFIHNDTKVVNSIKDGNSSTKVSHALRQKRRTFVYSRTFGNFYENIPSESHAVIPKETMCGVNHVGQKDTSILNGIHVNKRANDTGQITKQTDMDVIVSEQNEQVENDVPTSRYVCDLDSGVCSLISTDNRNACVSSDITMAKKQLEEEKHVYEGSPANIKRFIDDETKVKDNLVKGSGNMKDNDRGLVTTQLKRHDSTESIIKSTMDTAIDKASDDVDTFIPAGRRTHRCTAFDDDGNEVLCCILQAPGNSVDPSSFTCEVIDPLDVPPITRRHELLISHVIKFCTYNVGHIAKEREMVAKIPIAHFFVEPWQEVVIREVNKNGHWIETGEDVDIVQIPDMGNVVYGVQIALKELTFVAVVTRPRITTVTLEHESKLISSPSDPRVKLRAPGTSDPRRVTLQSIPITEGIIKQYENIRGPEITSYISAASSLVILSLEGASPESFSLAVPFTIVDYVSDYIKELEAIKEAEKAENATDDDEGETKNVTKKKTKDAKRVGQDTEEPEEIPNVPPRVRKRIQSELEYKPPLLQEQPHKNSAKSKFQELEAKVHKKEKERYLVQLGEGNARSIQIKLLDDSDRIKKMDIEETDGEHVKFSVYDTYARLFAVEFRDIINFREIQSAVKGLSNFLLKHRVRIDIRQDHENLFSVKFTASVDQPFRQRWRGKEQSTSVEEQPGTARFLEMNEGDAIGLVFRGNIEVTNQSQRVFCFHGYRGIDAAFDLVVRDAFSQKTLPEFHGAVQVYTLKRPRIMSLGKTRVQNISSDWDLVTEYSFLLPKHLKKTPIIINRAPISLRFQEPLTVDFVRQMCKELIKDWDTFAFALGISNARIQAIKQQNRNQISERVLMDVMVCWMKQQPIARDKVGPVLAALRMCNKTNLEMELKERHKSLNNTRCKTARDKHIQRAALALCQSRTVTVRWRQLLGYLLHLDTHDVKIGEVTSEIDEKYRNDATKCYHAIQFWKSASGSPTIWKVIDALRHLNCPVAANTLRFQEYKRLY